MSKVANVRLLKRFRQNYGFHMINLKHKIYEFSTGI